MNKIISKLGMCKVCLMLYIVFCSMLTSKNAFTQQLWQSNNLQMTYDKNNKSIDFRLLVYDYNFTHNHCAFLVLCDFHYSEDGKEYFFLLTTKLRVFAEEGYTKMRMVNKKEDETVQFFNCIRPIHGSIWKECIKELFVDLKINDEDFSDGRNLVKLKRSYLCFRWKFPNSVICVNHIKIMCVWKAFREHPGVKFEQVYSLNPVKSNSYRLQNASSVINSDYSDKVKVTKDVDAINVTGVEPGENIKVCTTSGMVIKSVVANDDVVKIKLPKYQMYIVKAGQASYKVAL